MEIHVVFKQDNNQYATFTYPANEALDQLNRSSIRIRAQNVSLTSNILSYARLGELMH